MSASPTFLIGNLTGEPELKYLANGTAKLAFSVAVNHYWTDQAGEKQEKTSFFNVIAWRSLAEDAGRVLQKGMRVVVTGRLEQRSWEKDDGTKGSAVELVADDIGPSVRALESVERLKRTDGDRPQKAAPKAAPKQQRITEDEEPF